MDRPIDAWTRQLIASIGVGSSMSLTSYRAKRNFKHTVEPRGKVHRGHGSSELRFVIQKHQASRLHYDFRLEHAGVLKSWAVPKGPSLDPSRRVLAVQVEDHPVEYGDFEGTIPAGEYGGGTVLLWDYGTWEPLHDAGKGLRAGKLRFVLHGNRLGGEWVLVRMHGRAGDHGKTWLLMKAKDPFAQKKDVLNDNPLSVKTNRSIEEISSQSGQVWKSDRSSAARAGERKASRVNWPPMLSPQLAVLADAPPEGDHWLHEIKFDGYRLFAYVNRGKVKLHTRNGHDWTHRFSSLAESLSHLKVDNAILDGEAVVLDKHGRSDFQSLQGMLKQNQGVLPNYYAFDLLYLNGTDLRNRPLIDRKSELKEILVSLPDNIGFSDHIRGRGSEVAARACRMALEGVISKRADAPYVGRRDPSWIKTKCQQRQEFVIIGYSNPQGHRIGFGSLLLGYHDEKRKLRYAGRVGTGFDDQLLKSLFKQLKAIELQASPTDFPPPQKERRAAHWVSPRLVAEVRFTGWTRDGYLRHPTFIALRSDKPASQIVREKPLKAVGTRKSTASKPTAASTRQTSASASQIIDGVTLTHPEKLLYADEGITKRQLADYYISTQKWMLPHTINRPLALVRCPAGQGSKCFFQRNYTETLPKAVVAVNVGEGRRKDEHVMVESLAGVLSLVQIGVLEIHTWNCTRRDIAHPDQLIFDLDPAEDVKWRDVIRGARLVRRALKHLGLSSFLKTSGGKGLHLTIPVEPTLEWDAAKDFCATIAQSLVEQSDLFVANMRKDLRHGKIFIDYHRNGRSATAVAPYSTRARPGAPVSMPISWEELGKLKSANHFTVETAGRVLEKRKSDPWKDFERSRVDLRKLFHSRADA